VEVRFVIQDQDGLLVLHGRSEVTRSGPEQGTGQKKCGPYGPFPSLRKKLAASASAHYLTHTRVLLRGIGLTGSCDLREDEAKLPLLVRGALAQELSVSLLLVDVAVTSAAR